MIVPVIIAGGKGLRLWPLSRETLPKPYIQITGSAETLLQSTLRRLALIEGMGKPVVVCNAIHGGLAQRQVAEVWGSNPAMLLEPEGRNTAPALCAAALAVERLAGSDAIMLALPSDHAIADAAGFARTVAAGAELAGAGYLVTFSIKPREPATGYGYLKTGAPIDAAKQQYRLDEFVEKPDRQRAEQFLASGQYGWNSGIFMFEAAALIKAFEQFQPDILAACRKALPAGEFEQAVLLDPKAFAAAPSISIDYAIMEKASNVATVLADFHWSDIGDWNAVWQEAAQDDKGVAARGDVLALDCAASLLQSSGPLLVGIGLEDMIAVATRDAVLVAPRARAQDVKRAADILAARGRPEEMGALVDFQPWGQTGLIHQGSGFRVKQLTINAGAGVDLEHREGGAVHWMCVAGRGTIARGDETLVIGVGDTVVNRAGVIQRLENSGPGALWMLEVSIGKVSR